MATSARVQVIKEVAYNEQAKGKEWVLWLQWCKYVYNDGTTETGYRFIWRRPDGSLQAARGQARIPDLDIATCLIEKAKELGWGNNTSTGSNGDKVDNK